MLIDLESELHRPPPRRISLAQSEAGDCVWIAMKRFLSLSLTALTVSFALVGCGKSDSAATADATPAAPTPAPAAAPVAAGPRVIEVTGNDSMRFSVDRIEAIAGEEITLKFTNVGTLPKAAMGHNWVLLTADADVTAYSTAAAVARDTEYLPAALSHQVLAATKLLGPKESDSITFTVPETAGEYPFLCSFPAHALAGMKGIFVVTAKE